MEGLNNNFIGKYREFTASTSQSGNTLSPEEIQKLETMVSSGQIDPATAAKLKEEIIKGGINPEERKLLLAIGHSITDTTKLSNFKHALDSDPVNGQIANLIDSGFETRKGEILREQESSPIESFFRGIGDSTGATTVYNATYGRVYGMVNTSEQEAAEETRTLVAGNDPVFNNSTEDVDCIKDSLKSIARSNPGLLTLNQEIPTRAVSETYLRAVTGKEWDGVNIKGANSQGNLANALRGQEGKALMVVGSHTFVFQGFDPSGNLKVTDPSDGNRARTIKKDNPAASAYVLKEIRHSDGTDGGDSVRTQGVNKGSDIRNLLTINKPSYREITSSMNSADNGNAESLNIRKLLSLMGDSSQREAFNKIKGYVQSGDVDNLKKFLGGTGINGDKGLGINLDTNELENMIIKMRYPITVNGQSTTMLNQLEKLENTGSPADKAKYQFGIQYSDVNLTDFFTRTTPAAMNEVFDDMIKGRDGC